MNPLIKIQYFESLKIEANFENTKEFEMLKTFDILVPGVNGIKEMVKKL